VIKEESFVNKNIPTANSALESIGKVSDIVKNKTRADNSG
jgi:hypothetical protein